MPNITQVVAALSKEQYLKLLEICQKKNITLYNAVQTAVINYHNLPKNPKNTGVGFSMKAKINELKKELDK